MQFTSTTVLGFFANPQENYEIPVYQRAYSWNEKDNLPTFLEDLLERLEGDNSYFYGNILLETIDKNEKYEIIDGQQRITTVTIFIRSLLNVLSDRKNEEPLIGFDFEEKNKIYLKNNGKIKLRPVEYDRACYDSLIIDNNKLFVATTPSQKKMLKAKYFFEDKLKKLSTDKILGILKIIEYAELTIIKFDNKKDSALMFELENNRGKELTNMEKIKSYFMYQMYVYSNKEDVEVNIEHISNIFKHIYITINDLKQLKEDNILLYHNHAYITGFQYRTLDDIKKKFKGSSDKVKWIKDYVDELHRTFSNMKQFEQSQDIYVNYLNKLKIPSFIYPFIIKGYKYFANDNKKLNELFHILEILTFRVELVSSRAKIRDRIHKILLAFDGNTDNLQSDIKNKLNASWYWSDDNIENCLYYTMYGNKVLNYLLWRYEESLQGKGYSIKNFTIENEEIEHISPKKPTNGEPIETGYDVDSNNEYSKEFISDYLNSIGNLMLISKSHNGSIGNKPFKDKLQTYNKNPLLKQQKEIDKFSVKENGENVWKTDSIDDREKVIIDFAIETWSFK